MGAFLDDGEDLVEEPRVDAGRLVHLGERHATAQQRLDLEDPLGCSPRRPRQQLGDRHGVDLDRGGIGVQSAAAVLERAQGLLE